MVSKLIKIGVRIIFIGLLYKINQLRYLFLFALLFLILQIHIPFLQQPLPYGMPISLRSPIDITFIGFFFLAVGLRRKESLT